MLQIKYKFLQISVVIFFLLASCLSYSISYADLLPQSNETIQKQNEPEYPPQEPYFLKPLEISEIKNSSVFYNSIVGKDHFLVRKMIEQINSRVLKAQNKIYPISYFLPGVQLKSVKFKNVYNKLPNFHPICNSEDEAFAIGKMGDHGINYEQVIAALEVISSYPKQGVMTEIGEKLYKINLDDVQSLEKKRLISSIKVILDRGDTPYQIDWNQLPNWKKRVIKHVPKFKLSHSFDIEKRAGEKFPPINLEELTHYTSKRGFQVGGWFIITKTDRWSYRSIEFSDKSYERNQKVLRKQALRLRKILKKLMKTDERILATSSASLKKVHAIWQIP
ncbi:MAG: hypothetical protein K0S74_355 [Chlamydiales bacterium]|jgi:hypothetical protein|nr:hypothetical protein [Chlamydiales bacterium]